LRRLDHKISGWLVRYGCVLKPKTNL
jgi:hypothetical protein